MLRALAAPDGEAILPLADLKARVRILSNDEDETVTRMRGQAIDWVERYTGIALDKRQFEYADRQFCRRIGLPIGPIVSVDAIEYDDAAGELHNLTAADWRFGAGTVLSAAGKRWPASDGEPGSVRIKFTAGLQNAATEAPSLIAAVELLVAHWFANREAVSAGNAATEVPFGVSSLCDQYRMPGL
jgi:uncharacterized phiE125 gp8 family phage protein